MENILGNTLGTQSELLREQSGNTLGTHRELLREKKSYYGSFTLDSPHKSWYKFLQPPAHLGVVQCINKCG
jgi:hypothetical protein